MGVDLEPTGDCTKNGTVGTRGEPSLRNLKDSRGRTNASKAPGDGTDSIYAEEQEVLGQSSGI